MLLIVLKKPHYVNFKDIQFFIFSIEVHLIYNVVLILCTSDSVIHIYIYIYIYIHTFFFNIHFHYNLSWDNEYSSLVTHPVCNSLPLLRLNSQSILPSLPPSWSEPPEPPICSLCKDVQFFCIIGDTF